MKIFLTVLVVIGMLAVLIQPAICNEKDGSVTIKKEDGKFYVYYPSQVITGTSPEIIEQLTTREIADLLKGKKDKVGIGSRKDDRSHRLRLIPFSPAKILLTRTQRMVKLQDNKIVETEPSIEKRNETSWFFVFAPFLGILGISFANWWTKAGRLLYYVLLLLALITIPVMWGISMTSGMTCFLLMGMVVLLEAIFAIFVLDDDDKFRWTFFGLICGLVLFGTMAFFLAFADEETFFNYWYLIVASGAIGMAISETLKYYLPRTVSV